MKDFFEQTMRLLRKAGAVGKIDPKVLEILAAPARVTSFRIPMTMDDGSFRVFDAHRVRYNDALGPSRDGTRISADLNLDEVKSLALIMSIKHAAGHIPAGGGKGGITADPGQMSRRELQTLCRAYMRNLLPKGSACDVPGADIGTDLQTMAWMLDEYESVLGRHEPAAVNDKPAILGGTLGGYEATGNGVFEVCSEAAAAIKLPLEGARVAIQGFGQVGSVAAALFQRAGCRVVAISEIQGGVFSAEGLDVAALLEHREATGDIMGFPGSSPINNDQILTLDCEVLVPAAVQGVITRANAADIQARLIVEAANAPTTMEADEILAESNVTVVPDVLANAGSVQLCQMERTQGLYDHYWDIESIDRLRREKLLRAFHEARDTAARHQVESMRIGAWVNALKRIEEAVKMRGHC